MADLLSPNCPELQPRFNASFRSFYQQAERRRRWNVEDDIPWELANPNTPAAIAAIVESFCAVELYLPDYVAKVLPMIRTNRAWSWTHINWGYEEAKHSLALEQWLIRSGHRTEQYVMDLAAQLLEHEWNLPQDTAVGMLMYAMVQEMATWLNYRNLRLHVNEKDDPCLWKLLGFVQVDERAHHSYYKEVIKVYVEIDRKGSIELLRRVLGSFSMPAINILAGTSQLAADIQSMNIFNLDIFYRDVYVPLLDDLGISRHEMRPPRTPKKSDPVSALA